MGYYLDAEAPTLESALAGCTADDLRRLASLTGEKPPTRKADIAAVIIRHLQGDQLRTVWQRLDELQQAAVAEVVHADSARFDAARFRAKYGNGSGLGIGRGQLPLSPKAFSSAILLLRKRDAGRSQGAPQDLRAGASPDGDCRAGSAPCQL
jgi:hypothetical protein